jgi:hypothetical protein
MIPFTFGLASFFVVAQATQLPDFEKFGFGSLVGFLVWWMTQRLSKQIDGLADVIRRLHESLNAKPCLYEKDRDHEGK